MYDLFFKEWLPKLYNYNMGWGSLPFINRECYYVEKGIWHNVNNDFRMQNLNVTSSWLIHFQVNHPMTWATQKLISLANEMACYNQN